VKKHQGVINDFGPAKGCAALDRDQGCGQFGADEQPIVSTLRAAMDAEHLQKGAVHD